ncbi:MAG: Flp pilus assembly protein TadG [Acidimicrobiales bacterium]|jgi:Flp pilus assembly protein TadG
MKISRCRATPRSGARCERGSVTLFGLGLVLVLLFVGGISLDLWRAFSERRVLAEVADAGAAAGANGLDIAVYRQTGALVLDPTLAHDVAVASVVSQTDDRSLTGGSVMADQDTVVVVIEGEVPLTLLRLFTLGEPFVITVRSEASPRQAPVG